MASNIIGPSMLPAPTQIWLESVILATDIPNFIHSLAAMRKEMPSRVGKTWRAIRYDNLPSAPIPLDEDLGEEIAPTPSSYVAVDAILRTYGQYVKITETVTLTHEDAVLNEHAKLLGVSMRRTEDELVRETLASCASIVNATGGTNGDSPTEMAISDVQEVYKKLNSSNAWTISRNIEAENKFGTAPQRDSYFAFAHSDLSSSFENLPNFSHKSEYPSPRVSGNAEWGSVGGLRVFLSSVGKIVPSSSLKGNDVYEVFVCGLESYAIVEQSNYTQDIIYHSPQQADPLEQYCTLGWKMRQAPVILNDVWMTRFRCTVSY
jgi:N4-gp56 family major capsid protein